jgi:hypothetical protein
MEERKFARLFCRDTRDDEFKLSAVLARQQPSTRRYRHYYDDHWTGDQGYDPSCVGFAWVHWLETGPIRHPNWPHPPIVPTDVYRDAQRVDEWPGENYQGTSVRAGRRADVARYRPHRCRHCVVFEDDDT